MAIMAKITSNFRIIIPRTTTSGNKITGRKIGGNRPDGADTEDAVVVTAEGEEGSNDLYAAPYGHKERSNDLSRRKSGLK